MTSPSSDGRGANEKRAGAQVVKERLGRGAERRPTEKLKLNFKRKPADDGARV